MKNYVVITGASSGIGAAAATKFAEKGKHLILIARRKERLETLKTQLQQAFPTTDVVLVPFDLTQVDQLEHLFQSLDAYFIETWINNAGFGLYRQVSEQSLATVRELMQLNVEALTILSTLYVQKYNQQAGTQLINVSSAGGYTMVPTAVTYCASKFYVSAFTENLALELSAANALMQAKVLAPAATQTEFGQVANSVTHYDYETAFPRYHTSEEMATFLIELYESEAIVGSIDREHFQFTLSNNKFSYAQRGNQQPIVDYAPPSIFINLSTPFLSCYCC